MTTGTKVTKTDDFNNFFLYFINVIFNVNKK